MYSTMKVLLVSILWTHSISHLWFRFTLGVLYDAVLPAAAPFF